MGYYISMSLRQLFARGLIACSLLGPAAGASAQAVRGVVVDDESGAPAGGASLVALVEGGATVATAVADSAGRFFMTLPYAGRLLLQVSRAGYRQATLQLPEVRAGVEIMVEVRIAAEAIVLAPIRVVGEREFNAVLMRGYYERAARRGQRGDGRFLMREQLDAMVVSQTSDYLRNVPSLQLRPVQRGGRTQYPVFRRFGTLCEPVVFLNGNRISAQDIDTFVVPGTLEGIEIYTQGDEPALYWDRSGCGVILMWTQSRTRYGERISWGRVFKFGGLIAGFGALFLLLH
jgi:hypothetical protein